MYVTVSGLRISVESQRSDGGKPKHEKWKKSLIILEMMRLRSCDFLFSRGSAIELKVSYPMSPCDCREPSEAGSKRRIERKNGKSERI